MKQHVERLRTKAPHVRRNIAFVFSAGVTAIIAVAWFGALAATGTFSLETNASRGNDATIAQNNNLHDAVTNAKTNFNQLLGAAGIASSTSTPTSLTIIETASSSTLDNSQVVQQDQTVIPF
jgi:hypothetical protein